MPQSLLAFETNEYPEKSEVTRKMVVVYYDLETTGLNVQRDQIISIGAITENGDSFEKFIVPTCRIHKKATNIHGMAKDQRANRLYDVNTRYYIDAEYPEEVLEEFMNWLWSKNASVLVAHGNRRFDSVIFENCMEKFGLSQKFEADRNEDMILLADSFAIMSGN